MLVAWLDSNHYKNKEALKSRIEEEIVWSSMTQHAVGVWGADMVIIRCVVVVVDLCARAKLQARAQGNHTRKRK